MIIFMNGRRSRMTKQNRVFPHPVKQFKYTIDDYIARKSSLTEAKWKQIVLHMYQTIGYVNRRQIGGDTKQI